jgi:threonine/homoserine/homoserine lactone efflux protein
MNWDALGALGDLIGGFAVVASLIYLAVQLWRGASDPIAIGHVSAHQSGSLRKFFLVSLATQLSNPETAIAYASIFTALLPADPPTWVAFIILPAIFLIETGWYAIVAIVFSSEGPRRRYLGAKPLIDRLAAGVIGLLGAKLISEAK